MSEVKCYLCNSHRLTFLEHIKSRPVRETDFSIPSEEYSREIFQCMNCGVYLNIHDFPSETLYSGTYNEASYKNEIFETYQRIMSLPSNKSDNKARVKRILDKLESSNLVLQKINALDIGSGLCVFGGEIMSHINQLHCIDPDPISVKHALENVKVTNAFQGYFSNYKSTEKFELITFNKVLEHIKNPIEELERCREFLVEGGLIYVELPDGLHSSESGGFIDREEFFLEHYTIFNELSMKYLLESSGFDVLEMSCIHEPSDKYTIFAFATMLSEGQFDNE